MTELERFWATVNGQRPDNILYMAWFSPAFREKLIEHAGTENLIEYYGLFEPVLIEPRPPEGYQPPDYSVYYADEKLPEGTTFNEYGVALIPSGYYHFIGYLSPLRNATSLREIEEYPVPDQSDWLTDHMAIEANEAHKAGKVVSCWAVDIYEPSWKIRGLEQFLMDMIERPAWAECLLDKLLARVLVRATAAARAGADFIIFGDDVAHQKGMMFSIPMWRKFIHSRWKKVWSAVREINPNIQIWYHSDGNIMPIIDELIEAGVTILTPIQPECMDPAEIRRKYPNLNLHGTIGTQSTFPFAKPHEVKQVVRERIATCGANGRLILAPTHNLEPDVPIENFEAYVEAAREGYKSI